MTPAQAYLAVKAIKQGIDSARLLGVNCSYPDAVTIDDVTYGFEESVRHFEAEAYRHVRIAGTDSDGHSLVDNGRVIRRTMTDAIRTKDGAA